MIKYDIWYNLFDIFWILITGNETGFTFPRVTKERVDRLNQTNKFNVQTTSPNLVKEIDIIDSLKAQIGAIWKFIVISFTVFFVLAIAYFGKRFLWYHKFRTNQVSNINTTSQKDTSNDNNQIEIFYDQVLDVEYVEPLQKQIYTYDEMHDDNSSIEPSKDDVALNGKNIIENRVDENRDIGLYLTPCL